MDTLRLNPTVNADGSPRMGSDPKGCYIEWAAAAIMAKAILAAHDPNETRHAPDCLTRAYGGRDNLCTCHPEKARCTCAACTIAREVLKGLI